MFDRHSNDPEQEPGEGAVGPPPPSSSGDRAAVRQAPGEQQPTPIGGIRLSPTRGSVHRPMPGAAVATIIGQGSSFNGTLRTGGAVHVQGVVEGEIISEGEVWVESSAFVRASVQAAAIRLDGTVEGNVISAGRVEVSASGRVSGDIQAGTLIMHEGALVDGTLRMGASGGRFTASTSSERPGGTGRGTPRPTISRPPDAGS